MARLNLEARHLIIDGKRLEVLQYAPGSNSTIVMLHEGLGSVAMWREFPEQLAQRTGCGILLYSRYGHGKSERLSEKRGHDFMDHEAKVVLPELFTACKVDSPILMGHSDGGSIALIYAGTWPRQVRALILEASHVFVENLSVASIAKTGELYTSSGLRDRLRRYHDHADEMFWGWNDVWLDPQFRRWNIEEYLDKITCPVLVIQGEKDEYGTLAQVQAITRRLPNTQTAILANCGHSPHRVQPDVTLETISQFLADVLRAQPPGSA